MSLAPRHQCGLQGILVQQEEEPEAPQPAHDQSCVSFVRKDPSFLENCVAVEARLNLRSSWLFDKEVS